MPLRMAKYGLTLHPDKTRLIPFGRPRKGKPKGAAGTFNFLGFTVYWRQTPGGSWVLGMKTRKARIRRTVQALHEFCRSHRQDAVKDQHKGLRSRIQGHFNYFAVNGNFHALARVASAARWAWHKWLNRRSQRSRMTWERFTAMLAVMPLPEPKIKLRLWGGAP